MRKGFTLTEILLALVIIGVVAMLTVPTLIGNINKKTFANQLKNMVANIEQVAQDELITKKTRDLSNTDFTNPDNLLSEDHFHISKTCSSDDSLKSCWKTDSSTISEKVTYKTIGNKSATISAGPTIILKNGVTLRYSTESNSGATVGKFLIDVNGVDKPNIMGRDTFAFYITPKGNVIGYVDIQSTASTLSTMISNCKTSTTNTSLWCYSALVNNSWKMDY